MASAISFMNILPLLILAVLLKVVSLLPYFLVTASSIMFIEGDLPLPSLFENSFI
jgi:hypothetical protein